MTSLALPASRSKTIILWILRILLAVDVGAFVAQIAVLHGDWIHAIVIGALLGTTIYLQRHRLG